MFSHTCRLWSYLVVAIVFHTLTTLAKNGSPCADVLDDDSGCEADSDVNPSKGASEGGGMPPSGTTSFGPGAVVGDVVKREGEFPTT